MTKVKNTFLHHRDLDEHETNSQQNEESSPFPGQTRDIRQTPQRDEVELGHQQRRYDQKPHQDQRRLVVKGLADDVVGM